LKLIAKSCWKVPKHAPASDGNKPDKLQDEIDAGKEQLKFKNLS